MEVIGQSKKKSSSFNKFRNNSKCSNKWGLFNVPKHSERNECLLLYMFFFFPLNREQFYWYERFWKLKKARIRYIKLPLQTFKQNTIPEINTKQATTDILQRVRPECWTCIPPFFKDYHIFFGKGSLIFISITYTVRSDKKKTLK